ncbi:MAG TPA: hypothetical protein ENG24_00140, partial [Thermoplasmatales archaeon]|nr:hypothetical protein [Thermoplasmatales archaeon]
MSEILRATAFAPGHISAFFEPHYDENVERSGSRGAGINLSLGAFSEVTVSRSTKQDIRVYINDKETDARVTKLALRNIIKDSPLKVTVKIKQELP